MKLNLILPVTVSGLQQVGLGLRRPPGRRAGGRPQLGGTAGGPVPMPVPPCLLQNELQLQLSLKFRVNLESKLSLVPALRLARRGPLAVCLGLPAAGLRLPVPHCLPVALARAASASCQCDGRGPAGPLALQLALALARALAQAESG